MPNRLPLPKSRFNAFASAALVVILMSIAVAFNTIATSSDTSGDTSSKPPTPATAIRIVTVVNVVVVTVIVSLTPKPTREPLPTRPPYIPQPTWVPTTFPMTGSTSGEHKTR